MLLDVVVCVCTNVVYANTNKYTKIPRWPCTLSGNLLNCEGGEEGPVINYVK